MQWKTDHTSNKRLSRRVICQFFFVFSHFIIGYFFLANLGFVEESEKMRQY